LKKPGRAGAGWTTPADGRAGCVIERSIGAAGVGAVRVTGGGVTVRIPRLPKLPPDPGRASAWLTASSIAATATATTVRRRNMGFAPQW
jgi:hypothetical protein